MIHPNYRGSDGYGRRWQLANRWLSVRARRSTSPRRTLPRVARLRPGRIAVTGRSHGGYLTMQMVTQFPELWACAVAGVPFFDHIDAQLDPDIRDDLVWWDRQNVGDIVTDRARLEYYSPINHLDAIARRCCCSAASATRAARRGRSGRSPSALRARGAVCELVIYPDEGHEISGLRHRMDYDRRTVEFILEHIGAPA